MNHYPVANYDDVVIGSINLDEALCEMILKELPDLVLDYEFVPGKELTRFNIRIKPAVKAQPKEVWSDMCICGHTLGDHSQLSGGCYGMPNGRCVCRGYEKAKPAALREADMTRGARLRMEPEERDERG